MDTYESIGVKELADKLGLDVRKVYALTKLKDDSLRPPGFKLGRQYRIWTSELPDYLHDGRFAKALEVIA